MVETVQSLAVVVAAHGAAGWAPDSPSARLDSAPAWWLHQIVLDDVVVGDVAFHGPPAELGPVEVEIGYDVVPAVRGRGIATRACVLIQQVAWRDGAVVVHADTDPDNRASQRVLLRSGFVGGGDFRFRVDRPVGVP